jgi:GTPase SAR1 family protein
MVFVLIVVLIGDSACGKTNLLTRFARNEFSGDTRSTIGVEFMSKLIKVESGKHAQIQVWCVWGEPKIRFFRGSRRKKKLEKPKPIFFFGRKKIEFLLLLFFDVKSYE